MTTENERCDIFVSYEWTTGRECACDLFKVLIENGFKVWNDDKNIAGDIESEMAKGVANSEIILLLISEKYDNSNDCLREYRHARLCRKVIIPIQVENYLPPKNSKLAYIISGKIFHQLYENKEENMKRILKEIKKEIGIKLSHIKGMQKCFYY